MASLDPRLIHLGRLHGEFPCDRSTQLWRIFSLAVCWLAIPAVTVGVFLEEFGADFIWAPGTGEAVMMVGLNVLNCLCLWFGYNAWLQHDHRYVFSAGEIKSIGRRTLWVLDLADVSEIHEYRSGRFKIWWLMAPQGQYGLVLYRSLRAQLEASSREVSSSEAEKGTGVNSHRPIFRPRSGGADGGQ